MIHDLQKTVAAVGADVCLELTMQLTDILIPGRAGSFKMCKEEIDENTYQARAKSSFVLYRWTLYLNYWTKSDADYVKYFWWMYVSHISQWNISNMYAQADAGLSSKINLALKFYPVTCTNLLGAGILMVCYIPFQTNCHNCYEIVFIRNEYRLAPIPSIAHGDLYMKLINMNISGLKIHSRIS